MQPINQYQDQMIEKRKEIVSIISRCFKILNFQRIGSKVILDYGRAMKIKQFGSSKIRILNSIKKNFIDYLVDIIPPKQQLSNYPPKLISIACNQILWSSKDKYSWLTNIILQIFGKFYYQRSDNHNDQSFKQLIIQFQNQAKKLHEFIQKNNLKDLQKHVINIGNSIQQKCPCGKFTSNRQISNAVIHQIQSHNQQSNHLQSEQILDSTVNNQNLYYCCLCKLTVHKSCFINIKENQSADFDCRYCTILQSLDKKQKQILFWGYIQENCQHFYYDYHFNIKKSALRKIKETFTVKVTVRCLQIQSNKILWPKNYSIKINGKNILKFLQFPKLNQRQIKTDIPFNHCFITNRIQFIVKQIDQKIWQFHKLVPKKYLFGVFLVQRQLPKSNQNIFNQKVIQMQSNNANKESNLQILVKNQQINAEKHSNDISFSQDLINQNKKKTNKESDQIIIVDSQ